MHSGAVQPYLAGWPSLLMSLGDDLVVLERREDALIAQQWDHDSGELVGKGLILATGEVITPWAEITPMPTGFAATITQPSQDESHALVRIYDCCIN